MDMKGRTTRQLHIGDNTIQCSRLELELREEITKLRELISSMTHSGTTDSRELRHLRELLDYRQALLEWLQKDVKEAC